jgi:regulator of protease activity HflC (stomatin/prohibitin superfamily)
VNLISLLRVVASFSWLAVIGAIAFVVARAARGQRVGSGVGLITTVVIITVVLNVLSAGLVFIEPTERGVVVSAVPGAQGVRPEALQPGLNWVVPFFDRVVAYPISRQTYTMSIAPDESTVIRSDDSVEARTADGQVVFVDASIIFALDPTEVINTHIRWENAYIDGLVRPLARGVIRDNVSAFGVEEVYSAQRAALTENIRVELEQRFNREGLLLIDFVLRNIAFSPEYANSVEQKQIAEQLAQQAQFVVEQRRQEAEQARQQAQGEADAAVIRAQGAAQATVIAAQAAADARLIQAEAEAAALAQLGQAIAANPDVLVLEYIEKIADNITVMLLPSNNPFLLPFPGLNSGFVAP